MMTTTAAGKSGMKPLLIEIGASTTPADASIARIVPCWHGIHLKRFSVKNGWAEKRVLREQTLAMDRAVGAR
jgi:hypothetical protein